MDKYIPIVVVESLQEVDRILGALTEAGINTAEITFRTSCAVEAIEFAKKKYPDMCVGAGTVINAKQCDRAIDAGAEFIVSPGLSIEVAEVCQRRGVAYYPGCVTPTEIMAALDLGLTTIKFFPSSIYGGLDALKALAAPFPQVRFIPTGGVDSSNMQRYLDCDRVVAVGGSFLVKDALQKRGKRYD